MSKIYGKRSENGIKWFLKSELNSKEWRGKYKTCRNLKKKNTHQTLFTEISSKLNLTLRL